MMEPIADQSMRVLVVEDSVHLRTSVAKALKRSGYAVDEAGDGQDGWWMIQENTYDAIVLDIMLPHKDGLTILGDMRRDGIETPVLLLTARNTIEDRVTGLRGGADDYLGKPFALAEFLARVDVLCRRNYGRSSAVTTIGDLELDTNAKVARRAGRDLDLTAREYALLELLMLQPGTVLSRTRIEEHLYDDSGSRLSNVVDSTIYHLRRKIGPDGASIIATRRGQGYVFQERTS
jgi:DNA-binding response OmpR family regulator